MEHVRREQQERLFGPGGTMDQVYGQREYSDGGGRGGLGAWNAAAGGSRYDELQAVARRDWEGSMRHGGYDDEYDDFASRDGSVRQVRPDPVMIWFRQWLNARAPCNRSNTNALLGRMNVLRLKW